jgi:hypothetical protein
MNASRYTPRFVDVFCRNCTSFLFKYRKSTDGPLMKCFIDKMQKSAYRSDLISHKSRTQI